MHGTLAPMLRINPSGARMVAGRQGRFNEGDKKETILEMFKKWCKEDLLILGNKKEIF